MNKEISHYVVTAHPPGNVLLTTKCNFLSSNSMDVLVAKSRRLEVRQLRNSSSTGLDGDDSILGAIQKDSSSQDNNDMMTMGGNNTNSQQSQLQQQPTPFPVVLQLPINGRLTSLLSFHIPAFISTALIFMTTERFQYAVISYNPNHTNHNNNSGRGGRQNGNTGVSGYSTSSSSSSSSSTVVSPYPIYTHASGSLRGSAAGDDHHSMSSDVLLGRQAETGPIIAIDHMHRCIVLHLYEGLITVIPINQNYVPPKQYKHDPSSTSTSSAWRYQHSSPHTSHHTKHQILGNPFHCRIEEHKVLAITFLHTTTLATPTQQQQQQQQPLPLPQLCILHQDPRGAQHIISHVINLKKKQLHMYGSTPSSVSTNNSHNNNDHNNSTTNTNNNILSNVEWLKKSNIDGGSSILIPVPPCIPSSPVAAAAAVAAPTSHNQHHTHNKQQQQHHHTGGVIVLGQRQLTYYSPSTTKIHPLPQALYLTYETLPPDPSSMMIIPTSGGSSSSGMGVTGTNTPSAISPLPRYLLGDEFGNLHMLTFMTVQNNTNKVVALNMETLGSCTISSSMSYLERGLLYVGSCIGDSQLIQIHDEPIVVDDDPLTMAVVDSLDAGVGSGADHDLVDRMQQQHQHPSVSAAGTGGAGAATSTMSTSSSQSTVVGGTANVAVAAGGGGSASSLGVQQQQQPDHHHHHHHHGSSAPVDLVATTYVSVVEEYTQLGPILDFDLVPTTPGAGGSGGLGAGAATGTQDDKQQQQEQAPQAQPQQMVQSQVVTCSGTSKAGSIRLIRNGIGMNEYASVEISGIQNMWSIRKSFLDNEHTYLIQSFVGETRILGVTTTTTTASCSSSNDEDDNGGDVQNMMLTDDNNDDKNNTDGKKTGSGNVKDSDAMLEDNDEDDAKPMGGAGNDDDDDDDDVGGTLEEVYLPGLEQSASTLYVGNVIAEEEEDDDDDDDNNNDNDDEDDGLGHAGNGKNDLLLQITETEIRLISMSKGNVLDQWFASSSTSSASSPSAAADGVVGGGGGRPIITVATANEYGQIAIALSGGKLIYMVVDSSSGIQKLRRLHQVQMDREVSCIDLHPFCANTVNQDEDDDNNNGTTAMNIDSDEGGKGSGAVKETKTMKKSKQHQRSGAATANKSSLLAVGLWDDFTVRLLSLESQLEEMVCIHLGTDEEYYGDMGEGANANSTAGPGGDGGDSSQAVSNNDGTSRRNRNNMMARSLCLLTLDFSSSASSSSSSAGSPSTSSSTTTSPGVNMLFVGLGDGTLISFAVIMRRGVVSVQSKKEVCLGTQCIDLVPLQTENGGTCILATGDRPTVIYLAGVGGTLANQFNPKLCYSNVNLAASSNSGDDDDYHDDVSRPPSQQSIAVNVATPFFSPMLFDNATVALGNQHYSLCVADDTNLRLGVIDDIQKIHVSQVRLGMAPRRIVHCPEGRLYAVGCIESGIKHFGVCTDDANMGNCIRFMDDTTFDDIEKVDLEPYEMILSMSYVTLKVPRNAAAAAEPVVVDAAGTASTTNTKTSAIDASTTSSDIIQPFLLVGTGYAIPDEDEPTRGRVLVYSCDDGSAGGGSAAAASSAGGGGASSGGGTNTRGAVRLVTEFSTNGAVYSLCQFYDGKVLCTVNSKTHICHLVEETGLLRLDVAGIGHHGHTLSLFVKSRATRRMLPASTPGSANSTARASSAMDVSSSATDTSRTESNTKTIATSSKMGGKSSSNDPEEMLAIVGDLMRSISLVQYYPQHQALEEVARDFNANWTTAIEMLNDNVYLGAENWNNLYCLRRNTAASSEEIRCRLDTMGEFHLGEMVNKFMSGSLIMPVSTNTSSNSSNSRGGGSGKRSNRRSGHTPKKHKTADSPARNSGVSGGLSRICRPVIGIGSQTLFGTVDGTLGVILGLDNRTTAFFGTLERAMARIVRPVGDFGHELFRARQGERFIHPSHGFIDGDLVESFLDFDRVTMEAIVAEMRRDGGWEVDDAVTGTTTTSGGDNDNDDRRGTKDDRGDGAGGDGNDEDVNDAEPDLTVDDVLAMVEEMTMLH